MTTHTTALLPDYTQVLEANRAAGEFTNYALALAKKLEPSDYPAKFRKAAVDFHLTSNTANLQRESREFVALLNRRTLLGKMQNATLTVPPFTQISSVTDAPDPQWVAEGGPIPLAAMVANTAPRTDTTKLAMMAGFVEELIRHADSRARAYVERVILNVLSLGEDRALLSDQAAVAHERPAGLLAGLSPIGGGSPASLADLDDLWSQVSSGDAVSPFFITSPRGGMYLASRNTDGTPMFPNAGPLGGSIAGVPLLTSRAAGAHLILLDASQLAVVDDGVVVESSRFAAVQMTDSPVDGAAQLVSAWQDNCVFLRFVRYLNWVLASDDAVAYLELPISGSPA